MGRIAQKSLWVRKTAQQQVCFVGGLHKALNRLDEAKKAGTYCYFIFFSVCMFVYQFSYPLFHSFSYFLSLSLSLILSIFLSLSLLCLFVFLKLKENREANIMSPSIEQRLLKICRYTRYVCLFFAFLLYYCCIPYAMLINHVLTSLFRLFLIIFLCYNNLGRGRWTRRLFYKIWREFHSSRMGTVLSLL